MKRFFKEPDFVEKDQVNGVEKDQYNGDKINKLFVLINCHRITLKIYKIYSS